MAVDILNLGFKVDTAQVKTASKDLDNLSRSAKTSGASINKMGADAQQSSKGMATLATSVRGLVGVYAGLAGVKALIGIADDYTKLTAQLKLATRSQDEFSAAFNNVQNIAKSAQASLSETAMLYARISNATRQLGANQTTVSAITESVALALKVSGATAAEASSSMLQLSQAFGLGALKSEEFNAVSESNPRIMLAIAEAMGVTISQLKGLAGEGKITSDVLGNALTKALVNLKKEAEQTKTIGGAFVDLKNNILLTAGGLDQATGASKAFASAIKAISDSGAIRIIFETIAVLGLNVAFVFKTIANEIVGFGKQLQALSNLDFKGAIAIGDQVGKDAATARVELDKLIESILNPAVKNSALKEEIVQLTKATGTLTAEEKQRAKEVENHQQAILKSIAIIQMENDLIKQGVPLQDAKTIAQMKANDATDKMIVSTLKATNENEKLTESYQANIDAVMDQAKAYSDLILGLEQSIQAQKDENDVTRGLAKSVEDLAIARLEEYKAKLAGLGYVTADLEREIELRKQLSSEMEYKKVLDAEKKSNEDKIKEAEKVADDLKKINDKVAEDFNKSLTDAIFRGFESGKSFAKTFKDSLINSFKTLILRPIVSFIVDSSGIATFMGTIMGGLSGTANAGTTAAGGVSGIAGAASSIYDAVTSGFETANIAFEQSIQQFGSWIANFSDGTGALADIGGMIGEYSGQISAALPYAGAVIKLIQGDFVSAAFTAAGTAIGTALGGPIGGFIGSFLGSTIGGLFGGAKTYKSQVKSTYAGGEFMAQDATGGGSRYLKGADQPLTQLSEAFAKTLSGLFKSASIDVDMSLTAEIGKKKRSWASFTATIGDEVFKTVVAANKGGLEKTLETLVGKTFSDVMIKAIQGSDLQAGIKSLFNDLTDKDQIIQMSQAAANLNLAEESLIKAFGLTAGQAAEVAIASTDTTEALLEFTNALASLGNSSKTIGDQILGIKNVIESAFVEVTGKDGLPKDLASFDELLKNIDKTTKNGLELFTDLFAIRSDFVKFTNAIDELKNGVSNALFNLMTPAEQSAAMFDELATLFGSLNLDMPTTVGEFQALARSIDYTSAEGLTLASVLPKLSAAFIATQQAAEQMLATANANVESARQNLVAAFDAERSRLQGVIDSVGDFKSNLQNAVAAEKSRLQVIVDNVDTFKNALRDAFNVKASGLTETINKFKDFGKSIKEFRLSLFSQSNAPVGNRIGFARGQFLETAALAQGGDANAMSSLASMATSYLDASENYSKDFNSYQNDFLEVSKILEQTESSALATADVAQLQLDLLTTQVGKLIDLNTTSLSVEQAITNLQTAQNAASVAQIEISRLNTIQNTYLGSVDGSLISVDSAVAELVAAQNAANAAQAELNALNIQQNQILGDVNNSVLSLADALKAYQDAITAQTAALAALAATKETVVTEPAVLTELERFKAREKELLDLAEKRGGIGLSADEINQIKRELGIPFANGGVFTNGIVSSPTAFNMGVMGEAGSEAIMPLTNINGSLGVTTNNSEMVKQLTIISDKMSRLEAAQIATVQNTGKVARIVERADNGDSLNVTVVT